MSERFNVPVLKTGGGEIHPRVRIPPLPPVLFFLQKEIIMEMELLIKWGLISAGVIGVYLFWASTTVKEGTNAIVTRFGSYSRTLAPGLRFIVPLFDKIQKTVVVTTISSVEMNLSVTTSDNSRFPINYTYAYRIDDPYSSIYGVDDCNSFVRNAVESAINKYIGSISYEKLKADTKDDTVEQIKKMARFDMQTAGVTLHNINFINIGQDEDQNLASDTSRKANVETEATLKRASASQKVTLMSSEDEAKRIEIIADAELEQLKKFSDQFGSKDKAAEYLLRIKHISAMAELAKSANSKMIFADGNSFSRVINLNDSDNNDEANTPA